MPHLYTKAVDVINSLEKRKGSLKSLVFNQKHNCDESNSKAESVRRAKQLFALVSETLKFRKIIDELIKKCNIPAKLKGCVENDAWLARVLIYDLLFGKGIQGGKFKLMLQPYRLTLNSELIKLKVKAKVTDKASLLAAYGYETDEVLPRYARINTLKAQVDDVIRQFSKEFTLISGDTHSVTGAEQNTDTERRTNYEQYINLVKNLGAKEFTRDIHIPELLVFCAGTRLHEHALYKNGSIVLQDKASCVPAFVLGGMGCGPLTHVIDCCAAPGNKTSHAAAILNNSGRIFAFDKDPGRVDAMRGLLQKAGVNVPQCVDLQCGDFLRVDPSLEKYGRVTHAIVDPSCSGSGIVSRRDGLTDASGGSDGDQGDQTERLKKLAAFQVQILKHALSFPAMQFVVYSTCSVHEEENEQVVKTVLESVKHQFEPCRVFPASPHRGLASHGAIGRLCVRLDPAKDRTNGFFVACLRRKSAGGNDIGGNRENATSSSKRKVDSSRFCGDEPSSAVRKRKCVVNNEQKTLDCDIKPSQCVSHIIGGSKGVQAGGKDTHGNAKRRLTDDNSTLSGEDRHALTDGLTCSVGLTDTVGLKCRVCSQKQSDSCVCGKTGKKSKRKKKKKSSKNDVKFDDADKSGVMGSMSNSKGGKGQTQKKRKKVRKHTVPVTR